LGSILNQFRHLNKQRLTDSNIEVIFKKRKHNTRTRSIPQSFYKKAGGNKPADKNSYEYNSFYDKKNLRIILFTVYAQIQPLLIHKTKAILPKDCNEFTKAFIGGVKCRNKARVFSLAFAYRTLTGTSFKVSLPIKIFQLISLITYL